MLEKILNFFSTDKNPDDAEKLQKKNVIVIGVSLFAIILFLMFVIGGDENTNKKNKIGEFKIVTDNEAAKTAWIGKVAPEVEVTNKQVREVLEQNKQLKKEINMLKKMIIQMKKNKPQQPVQNEKKINLNLTPNNANQNLYTKFPLPPKPKSPKEVGLNELGRVPILKKRIIVKKEELKDPLAYAQISQPEKPKPQPEKPKPENIILTGTITKVILLGGMDAPTMARAKNNPLPVLMKVMDLSFLPNDWREDIKGCFILGEGYGDLSSERAYIKTTTLSCVTKDGYHIDTPFRGAVYGEDGKVGLRGRVVTKQGALIARTLLAGFLQGVSEAFKQNTTIVSVSPQGSTQTINPNKALQAGTFNGFASATQKLADFYLKMADQIAPVIEISAGRRVDVISLEPVKLKPIEFLKKKK